MSGLRIKNNVGANGEDAVTEITKSAFVALTPEAFTYDADGNLTQDGRWTYGWNAENQLVSVETIAAAVAAGVPKQRLEFAYDAQGRRIQKVVKAWNTTTSSYQVSSDTRFLYDGWNLLAEFDGLASNAVVRTYAWGLDLGGSLRNAAGVGGLLAVNNGSATYFPTFDGGGNIIGLVNASTGTLDASFEFDPFGSVIKAVGVAANVQPFGFSTRYTDQETGHLYDDNRYQDVVHDRFLNRDPLEEQGGVNLYNFCGNDAINRIDPFGLEDCQTWSNTLNVVFDNLNPPSIPLPLGASIRMNGGAWLRLSLSGKKCKTCCGGDGAYAYRYEAKGNGEGGYRLQATVGWQARIDYTDVAGLRADMWLGGRGSMGGQVSVSDNYTWGGCKGEKFNVTVRTSINAQISLGGQVNLTWRSLNMTAAEATGNARLDGFETNITFLGCDETGCHGGVQVTSGDRGRLTLSARFCVAGFGCFGSEKSW